MLPCSIPLPKAAMILCTYVNIITNNVCCLHVNVNLVLMSYIRGTKVLPGIYPWFCSERCSLGTYSRAGVCLAAERTSEAPQKPVVSLRLRIFFNQKARGLGLSCFENDNRFPVLNKHRIGTTFYLNGETSPQNRETTRPEEEWKRGDSRQNTRHKTLKY